MSRELLQQALDALEWLLANIRRDAPQLSGKAMGNAESACTAIRAVLAAQPAPVPAELVEAVAKAIYYEWRRDTGYVPWVDGGNSDKQDDARKIARAVIAGAAPVLEEFDMADDGGCPVCGEDGGTSCGMPNCGLLSAPPVPQAEPVAWLKTMYSGTRPMLEVDHLRKDTSIPVYTHPAAPVPVPLTDEQLRDIARALPFSDGPRLTYIWQVSKGFARAIERAHGIATSPEVTK
jgi:hypothetical protein